MPPDEDRYYVPNWAYELLDNGFITRNSGKRVPLNFDIDEDLIKEWSLFDTYQPSDVTSSIDAIVEDEIEYRKNNKFVSFEEMMGGIKE